MCPSTALCGPPPMTPAQMTTTWVPLHRLLLCHPLLLALGGPLSSQGLPSLRVSACLSYQHGLCLCNQMHVILYSTALVGPCMRCSTASEELFHCVVDTLLLYMTCFIFVVRPLVDATNSLVSVSSALLPDVFERNSAQAPAGKSA